MINTVFLLLAAASLSIIVTKSDAFAWLRKKVEVSEFWQKYPVLVPIHKRFLNKVLNCPLCFGFYSYFICLGISIIPVIGFHIILGLCSAIIALFIWSKI